MKHFLFLTVIASFFLTSCQKKEVKPPLGKVIFQAKKVNILPKTQTPKVYWIQLDDVMDEVSIADLKKSEIVDLMAFYKKCEANQFLEKPYKGRAFILAQTIDQNGEIKEHGSIFELKTFQYDPTARKVFFEATSLDEISPWIQAKPSKLVNFELFFENRP